jgi:Baseplate J-like protein
MALSRRQLFIAYVVSVLAVLFAAVGSLLLTETAAVKLSVPPQRVVALVTLAAGLQTQRIHADVTDSQQGTASTVLTNPIYAAGQVVFSCSPACKQAPVTIPQGTLVTTAKSLGYTTQAAVMIATTTGSSAPVAVRATAPGAAWNADPNTLTGIANPNAPDANLHVTNPAAIIGGANPRSAQVIQQSDFDAVRNALTVKVNDELAVALNFNAHGMSFVADGAPVINLTSDHSVGDETPTFTITMTGTSGAVAFSDSEAVALLRSALQSKIPTSDELTNDPIQAVYQVGQANANGDVSIIAKASGFAIPRLSQLALRSQIRGLTPTQAARSLQRTAPGSVIEIRISPSAMPWLPVVADHISLTVVVEKVLVPFSGG